VIELKNITAGYGRDAVLTDFSAVFEKGKLTAIVGTNGCGKSTLLKTTVKILPCPGGEIFVDGVSLRELSRRETARKIAYLPQGRGVPDMTAEQMILHGRFPHLRYPRQYTVRDREIAYTAAEKMGVSSFLANPLSALSGGIRQKVYLAMALAGDGDYILLDEPTTYLDIGNQLELMRILRSLADSGKGIAAVLHDLPMAFGFSDSVIVVRNGTADRQMSPQELCSDPVIEEIFGVALDRSAEGRYFYRYGGVDEP